MAIVTAIELLESRRTKIVATLGPACDPPGVIPRLIAAGVDVFRLNFSHGTHAEHGERLQRVRAAAAGVARPVAILADLCGPKIRVGRFPGGGIDLPPGGAVTVTTRAVDGAEGLIPSLYTALADDVQVGDRVLLADGALELEVLAVDGTEVHCRVRHGGWLGDHKGINLPGVAVSAPSMTEKDLRDAAFALECDVDFLALSFVRRAEDVEGLRSFIVARGGTAAIIAKIEKPEALGDAARILAAADGIMVARGDLGVELAPEQVPLAQSQLIDLARRAGRPVIVATQMLESMIEHPRPTRAEVTDVAHAVVSGTDAVMLSAETAAGAHPVEAVEMMARIVRQMESYQQRRGARLRTPGAAGEAVDVGVALADATAELAQSLPARAVFVITQSGTTARTVSAARPPAPVVALTNSARTWRRMSLLWGVIPAVVPEVGTVNPNLVARRTALGLGLAGSGDHVLLVRGFHAAADLNVPSVTVVQC